MDIILREVKGYGWLPLIRTAEGELVYRGEYQATSEDALNRCIARIESQGLEG